MSGSTNGAMQMNDTVQPILGAVETKVETAVRECVGELLACGMYSDEALVSMMRQIHPDLVEQYQAHLVTDFLTTEAGKLLADEGG